MKEVSLKTVFRAVFYAVAAMALSVCVEPVNLTGLLEDPKVKDIIEQATGKAVNIINEDDWEINFSDSGLVAGNGRISGLRSDKYYIIEEYVEGEDEGDEEGHPPSVRESIKFVKSDGTLSEKLVDIGRVSDGRITGLTNDHWYVVKSAQPLTGNVSYIDLVTALHSNSSGQQAKINEGAVIFQFPDNGGLVIFTPPLPLPIGNYDIVTMPVSPAGPAATPLTDGGDILVQAAEETTIDYIFFEKDNEIAALHVLRIVFPGKDTKPPVLEGITVNITLALTGDNSPQIDNLPITYSQDRDDPITISVNNAAQYDDYDTTGIKWYINGVYEDKGSTFNLDTSIIEYKIVGVYTITVEAVKNGIPYSTVIDVTVTP